MRHRSYEIAFADALNGGYDTWAASYDRDCYDLGYATPEAVADVVCRHIPQRNTHLLDVGAGTGLLGEALHRRGYRHLVGCDCSTAMLAEASRKGVYRLLCRMVLGRTLGFPDRCFDGLIAAGVFTPGQAPPHSLFELTRLVRPGGWIIFSLKWDGAFETAFMAVVYQLEIACGWQRASWSAEFCSWPCADPKLQARVLAYRVRTEAPI
ncbi:MAG: class I SAM-dependent methyltransferase, partial [Desulfobacterales bacterium]|jgi:predicted TPR repeat methyltransferase